VEEGLFGVQEESHEFLYDAEGRAVTEESGGQPAGGVIAPNGGGTRTAPGGVVVRWPSAAAGNPGNTAAGGPGGRALLSVRPRSALAGTPRTIAAGVWEVPLVPGVPAMVRVESWGGLFNPWLRGLFLRWSPSEFLTDLLVGPYGVITMGLTYAIAIVLPIVATFFFCFSVLEDSGYLPRLAVMVNRMFRLMGLNGRAVLPMVLGLGCDTMATLTTRILGTRKDRLIVILLLALGIPCSAQLGVILGMLAGLSWKATALWCGVLAGVILLVGFLASKVIPGERSEFILEIPPLRLPAVSNLIRKTLARVEWYLKEAVPLFILGTLVLFFADKTGLLGAVQRGVEPVVTGLLGLPAAASDAFIIGFLRRDFGAAGLFRLASDGQLDPVQTVVSLVTITLFIPCIANLFMIIKEQGTKVAALVAAFIFPFALLVGGALNFCLRLFGVDLL
jgi:ferrous iron transport protein B